MNTNFYCYDDSYHKIGRCKNQCDKCSQAELKTTGFKKIKTFKENTRVIITLKNGDFFKATIKENDTDLKQLILTSNDTVNYENIKNIKIDD